VVGGQLAAAVAGHQVSRFVIVVQPSASVLRAARPRHHPPIRIGDARDDTVHVGAVPWSRWLNDDIRKAWEKLSLMQKRAILDVVADVTVLPTKPTTRGFDPDGVKIEWKTR
jgi:hypothetical protein